ncbi:MAG: recombinase family protein [Deltaproteobacteria bacterium]|jgi:DNA invertase Pin-like site-specific DNA recombinase
MRTVAYVRVSSESQDLATQRDAIGRLATVRGHETSEWYAEKASGKTMARPELGRLRQDARRGDLERIYVFKLDRLTRSGLLDTVSLVQELQGRGVELVSVADGFDLSGRMAELVIAVMGWAAQFEREQISARTAAARTRLEAEGRAWGWPRRMNAMDVERASELRAAGRSVREIAVALRIPKATVARALARPAAPPSQ